MAIAITSHPVRVRGLKLFYQSIIEPQFDVAPRAGAWIETFENADVKMQSTSHPVRVRGLKLLIYKMI
jgi:hypothetical protein